MPAQQTPTPTLGARLRYRFDAALSRGPSVVIGWLGLLTLAIIAVAALLLTIARLRGVGGETENLGFAEALWQSMLRVVDAGSFAGDTGWPTRILGLAITLAGIFLAGSLIGLIASAVDQRIELLRKGRSAVLEDQHTLILGWSDRVPAIVSELILANESRKHAAVVVLAGVDKTEMEETLRDAIADFGTTRLVCRSGNTSSFADLELVNLAGARSIVVIGGNDAGVVKTLLAIRQEGSLDESAPVVAEVNDADIAESIRSLFGQRVVIVNSDSVVAELTAQACRQRGLSQVFHELLDFDGDEIYFAPFPELAGRSYREAQLAFETSCVMGMLDTDGRVTLNPSPSTVLTAGDELIGIASDDSTFISGQPAPAAPVVERPPRVDDQTVERRMILVGWSVLGPRVVYELDEFLGPETTLEIFVDPDVADLEDVRAAVTPQNLRIEFHVAHGRPEEIARDVARRAFDEVIVLGRRDGMSTEEADANTLLTLLAFNQAARAGGLGSVRIVAELLEQRHAPLAQATGADDFIVSDELTSLMIAQLSERHELDLVFRDLLDRNGSTIEMAPADRYDATNARTFADVVAAASAQGHSALGYRRDDDGTVHLNPPKRGALSLREADSIVVLR